MAELGRGATRSYGIFDRLPVEPGWNEPGLVNKSRRARFFEVKMI